MRPGAQAPRGRATGTPPRPARSAAASRRGSGAGVPLCGPAVVFGRRAVPCRAVRRLGMPPGCARVRERLRPGGPRRRCARTVAPCAGPVRTLRIVPCGRGILGRSEVSGTPAAGNPEVPGAHERPAPTSSVTWTTATPTVRTGPGRPSENCSSGRTVRIGRADRPCGVVAPGHGGAPAGAGAPAETAALPRPVRSLPPTMVRRNPRASRTGPGPVVTPRRRPRGGGR